MLFLSMYDGIRGGVWEFKGNTNKQYNKCIFRNLL